MSEDINWHDFHRHVNTLCWIGTFCHKFTYMAVASYSRIQNMGFYTQSTYGVSEKRDRKWMENMRKTGLISNNHKINKSDNDKNVKWYYEICECSIYFIRSAIKHQSSSWISWIKEKKTPALLKLFSGNTCTIKTGKKTFSTPDAFSFFFIIMSLDIIHTTFSLTTFRCRQKYWLF